MSATVTDRTIPDGWEVHTTPNGVEIFYRDSDHSYWGAVGQAPKGKWTGKRESRMAGVSTVVAPYDWNPDGLMRWAVRIEREGIAQIMAMDPEGDDTLWLLTADSIEEKLRIEGLRYSDSRDDAATRGTNVHRLGLEALASGQPMPDTDAMTDEERQYVQGLIAFWHENEPDAHYSELMVCDPALRVSGRLDMIATLGEGKYRGKRLVIDAKTSESRFVPNKHHVQLAGYQHCAEASGYGKTDGALILRLSPHGTYELVQGHATGQSFLNAVAVYRDAAEIAKNCQADRKAAA